MSLLPPPFDAVDKFSLMLRHIIVAAAISRHATRAMPLLACCRLLRILPPYYADAADFLSPCHYALMMPDSATPCR